ncbi:hypothetical protein FBU30_011288 [Linnemannia zychae]|nr:hypothetical protein FBU30_011288 [Linnemannia zychae]
MVKRYLAHPQVGVTRNIAATHFEAAVRVFAGQQFKVLDAATLLQSSDQASATKCSIQISSDLTTLHESLAANRRKQQTAEQPVQETSNETEQQIDKSTPDSPLDPPPAVSSKPKPPKRLPSVEGMDKKDLVNAMATDHPMRTIDTGTINANAARGLSRAFGPESSSVYLPCIKNALRNITHQSSSVKRICQRAIGSYLEHLALSINEPVKPEVSTVPLVMDVLETIESTLPFQEHPRELGASDRLILAKLCPKFTVKDIADGSDINDETIEDLTSPIDSKHDDTLDNKDELLLFLKCLMNAVYSGKLPKERKGKDKEKEKEKDEKEKKAPLPESASTIRIFIERAKDFLPPITEDGDGIERDFAGSSFLRSAALHLSVELKMHYRKGSLDLCKKIIQLKEKKLLPLEARDCIDPSITPNENFILLNRVRGCPRSLVPMSLLDDKFITVSELDLIRIIWRYPVLRNQLQSLAWSDFPSIKYADQVSQPDVTMWLSRTASGTLITKFLSDIGGYSETERKKLRSYSRSTRLMSLEETRHHIQNIRHADFQPFSYTDKGYILSGSIRTDGFHLQLIAFKLNELNSIKYRRLPMDRLPNHLTSTIGGTDYFLTEIRNVVSTPQDVVDLWGCDPEKSRFSHLDAKDGSEEDKKNPLVKQPKTNQAESCVSAYFQTPTLDGAEKGTASQGDLRGGESINQIETSLPARIGSNASIAEYIAAEQKVKDQLSDFYGSVVLKKYLWNARKARDEEYRLIANRLLEMVGGSLGARRKQSNKVIIGVGLGTFSKMRLSSLHGSFGSHDHLDTSLLV